MIFPIITAFQCVLNGRPIHIPTQIDVEFVRFAEEITEISYSQSETFSSVSGVHDCMSVTLIVYNLYNTFMNCRHC